MPDRDDSRWPRKMCSVCRRRLNPREDSKTGELIGYMHAGREDHAPRPVNEVPDDSILVCDFCLIPHPVWDFPCGDMIRGVLTADNDLMVSASDWAACDPCKRLIMADRYDLLVERVAEGHMRKDPKNREVFEASPALMVVAKMNLAEQMQDFKKARTGAPIPLKQATWIATQLRQMLGEQE